MSDSPDAIAFRCPQCGAVSSVPRELAGTTAECPRCGCQVAIPTAAEAWTPPAESGQVARPPTGAPIPRMSPPTDTLRLPPTAAGGRKGLPTIVWVLIIGAVCIVALTVVFALVLGMFLPSLARARELSRRSVCAANLKGISIGFHSYSGENSDDFPMVAAPRPAYQKGQARGLVDYSATIGSFRGSLVDLYAGDTLRMDPLPTKLSVTRNSYTLVRVNMLRPGSFICPSSSDASAEEAYPGYFWDFGRGDVVGPVDAQQARTFWTMVSYGYQVPYGQLGQPSRDRGLSMILAADKGPFGASLDAGLPHPGPVSASPNAAPKQWRPWNSANHGGQGTGEGQNVVRADGRVEWAKSPDCGVEGDNIYTQWANAGVSPQDRSQGNPPTRGGRQVPVGDTDSLIYP